MLRFLITILCFGGILCIGNICQVRKIQDGKPTDILMQLNEGIRPAYAFLHPKQRVFYKGLEIVAGYDYYFLATQLMAPSYVLEFKKEPPQQGDTVLVICNSNELHTYFPKNDLQIIWQHADAQYNYFLGKQI